jgi:hypothetical protein
MLDAAVRHSLAAGSFNTYQTGARALNEFADAFHIGFKDMSESDPASVQLMFQMVACHLRASRNVKAVTIDQYITHMVTLLKQKNWAFADHIRSPILKFMIKGWLRIDIFRTPRRLSCHIPATAPVMRVFFEVAAIHHRNDPQKAAEVRACAAIQYYCALRANEAAAKSVSARESRDAAVVVANTNELDDDDESPDVAHHLMAAHCHFQFIHDDRYYPAHAGTVFPPGKTPDAFDILQDTHKTSSSRGSSHRGAYPNPNSDKQPFCVMDMLWHYVTHYPPPANGAFFPGITSADVTLIMKMTANKVGLDEKRMSSRAIRSGSATMFKNMKTQLIDQQQLQNIRDQGNWVSNVGERIYAHDDPASRRILSAPTLYDAGFMTIAYLIWYYMTPAV